MVSILTPSDSDGTPPAELVEMNRRAVSQGIRPIVGPPALFAYRTGGEELAGPGLRAVSGYEASTMATTVEWAWDDAASAWVRTQNGTPHVDADGGRVTAINVVVRTIEYRDSGVRDSTGAVVAEALTVGEGDAWLLSDGQALPARWQKTGERRAHRLHRPRRRAPAPDPRLELDRGAPAEHRRRRGRRADRPVSEGRRSHDGGSFRLCPDGGRRAHGVVVGPPRTRRP